MHRARDRNATRLRDPFQSCSNIDAVAKDVVAVDDDIANMDADADFDPLVLRRAGTALTHGTLKLYSAPGRIYRTGKLDQQAVACGLHDAPAMLSDLWVYQRAPVFL